MSSPTSQTMEVEAGHHPAPKGDILTPDVTMLILTWVTFFSLLVILHKFAWKPILDALQKREKEIRDTLDNADKAKARLAQIEEERQKIIDDAKTQATQIIENGRVAAKELAADIEAKSRQHAENITQSAHEEIAGEKQRLLKNLRQESADLAISLATKIIGENMDQDKNRRLVDEAIKQL